MNNNTNKPPYLIDSNTNNLQLNELEKHEDKMSGLKLKKLTVASADILT